MSKPKCPYCALRHASVIDGAGAGASLSGLTPHCEIPDTMARLMREQPMSLRTRNIRLSKLKASMNEEKPRPGPESEW